MIVIEILVIYAVNLLLYRVQFLLGDKTNQSPNPIPSLYANALLEVDLGLVPYKSIADSVVLYRTLSQTVPLDLYPSIALVHCKSLSNNQ